MVSICGFSRDDSVVAITAEVKSSASLSFGYSVEEISVETSM